MMLSSLLRAGVKMGKIEREMRLKLPPGKRQENNDKEVRLSEKVPEIALKIFKGGGS